MASFRRELAWRAEAAAFAVFGAALRLLPVDAASGLGGALGRLLGPLTGAHRVAARNIEIAFPELDAAHCARLLRAQWDNTGRTFFELPIADRLTEASGRLEIAGRGVLEAVARDPGPTVLVSGHFANWEVMAAAFTAAGVDALVTYRAANNPYVDAMIRRARARYGVRLFAPKGAEGSRALMAALEGGAAVAIMNDQKFNGGVAVPFFGRLAHTAVGPSRLALRFDAPIVLMSVQRLRGARFRVTAHPPIRLERTGARAVDLEAGVRRITAFVEAQVRANPAQWFWVHKRWPVEAYTSPPP